MQTFVKKKKKKEAPRMKGETRNHKGARSRSVYQRERQGELPCHVRANLCLMEV